MAFAVVGQGDPLVLVHGLGGSPRWWEHNLELLGSRFELHLVDLPRRLALADAPSWLAGALAEAGLARAHVLGHSFGAAVAVRLAAERPELVDRLVLVSPAGLRSRRTLLGHALPLAASLRTAPRPFLRVIAGDALRAGPLALARTARDLLAGDTLDALRDVRAPTLLLFGRRDAVVPLSLADVYGRELRDSRLVVLDTGHVPMAERPHEFDAAVADFLTARR